MSGDEKSCEILGICFQGLGLCDNDGAEGRLIDLFATSQKAAEAA
jgi:hypothetical protein